MRTRKLGCSDLEITTIGFGAWAAGGGGWAFGWGPQDDDDSVAAMARALDEGVNWIDTAPVYGLGHSEEVVGRLLKGLSSKPIVATKCGLVWDEGGEISGSLKRASVRREAEASLKRLGVERIDLYQVHWPDPVEDIEEGWEELSKLVKEGKLRHIGVSNFSVEQMKRVLPIHPIASLQPPYSMLVRGIERKILPFCAENGIGVIIYSPMQTGILTGKFTVERVAALPDDDWRKTKNRHFQEPDLSANIELAGGLKAHAEKQGRSAAQLAVAWTLRRSEVTAAIVGGRKPEQVSDVASAGDWELSDEDLREVDALLEKRDKRLSAAKA